MTTTPYIVTEGETVRLIEAVSAAQVLKFVTTPRIKVKVATRREVMDLMSRGVKPEQAKTEPEPT
jgi:hypothetical protein